MKTKAHSSVSMAVVSVFKGLPVPTTKNSHSNPRITTTAPGVLSLLLTTDKMNWHLVAKRGRACDVQPGRTHGRDAHSNDFRSFFCQVSHSIDTIFWRLSVSNHSSKASASMKSHITVMQVLCGRVMVP